MKEIIFSNNPTAGMIMIFTKVKYDFIDWPYLVFIISREGITFLKVCKYLE